MDTNAFLSKFLNLFVLSLSLLVWNLPAHAESPETLNWNQALQETLSNNQALRAASEKLEALSSNIKGSRSNFFPQLSGTLNYNEQKDPNTNGDHQSYGATLSLSQNLFNGFQDQARVDLARANFSKEQATFEEIRASVVANLKNAFSALHIAQAQSKLQEAIIKRRNQNLNLISLRFKSGRENRGSVLLSQAYSQQAEFDFLTAQNAVEIARSDLARVLGREQGDFELTGEVPLVPLPEKAPDFRQLADTTPQSRQSLGDIDAAKANLVSARSGFFPTLGLSATKGENGTTWFPQKDTWTIGASLSFPLFNGGKDYYAAQSASASLNAARATLNNVTKDRVTQLRSAYYAYAEARERVKVDSSFRDAAKLRAEIARAKYNNGLTTFDDWDIVENDLIAREKAYLNTLRDLVSKEAAWLAAQGKDL